MKKNLYSLLTAIIFVVQMFVGLSVHAEIDEETKKKAAEFIKKNFGEQPPVVQTPPPPKQPDVAQPPVVVVPVQPKPNEGTSQSATNKLKFATVVDIGDYKGNTFFALMQSKIKPELDEYAERGFEVILGDDVEVALSNVDRKVSRNAISNAGSVDQLKSIADQLHAMGKFHTFYELPDVLGSIGVGGGRWNLTTFLALVSGGGVAVKINEENYAYNVNYGTGEIAKDEMTGRSFGEAPGRLALDASDAHYLTTLQSYVRSSGNNIETFFLSILEILTNNDTSRFSAIKPAGQAVAADFIAVYIAEQDRHLMANLQTHHWDEALLEVTLLAAFHAGQDEVSIMHEGLLKPQTAKQTPGCFTGTKSIKPAGMIDYWQFSKSTDPESCNRSGINVTRRDFRKLESIISAYEIQNNPDLVNRVNRHFKSIQINQNVFANLSAFLINFKTPRKLDNKTLELAKDFTAFLMQVNKDAQKITESILASQVGQ